MSPTDVEEYRAELQGLYPSVPAWAGSLPLVRQLREAGFPCAIATSSERAAFEKKMVHHPEILCRMSAVVCGDEVAKGKPAPDIFLEACRRLGVPGGRARIQHLRAECRLAHVGVLHTCRPDDPVLRALLRSPTQAATRRDALSSKMHRLASPARMLLGASPWRCPTHACRATGPSSMRCSRAGVWKRASAHSTLPRSLLWRPLAEVRQTASTPARTSDEARAEGGADPVPGGASIYHVRLRADV